MLRTIVILASALCIELLGAWLGLRLGLSQFYAVGLGFFPAMLLVFPVVKQISGRSPSFLAWSVTVAMICVAAGVLHFVIRD